MKYEYSIVKSRRRSVSIEIDRDLKITVRAPLTMPESVAAKLVEEKEKWIEKHLEIQKARVQNCPYNEADKEPLRERAKAVIPEKVQYFSRLMKLTPTGVKITDAAAQFGSCSAKNSLCFSLRLMAYPEEAIDYVVVHELAHIKYHNHSKAFYHLIEKYIPDYKAREKVLKGK